MSIFEGIKFWVAQRVPMRSHYLDKIRSNGGEIVPLEKQADYLVVDHMRKELPAGSVSYTFIEESIKTGELADIQDHRCGPPVGSVRDVGSVRPGKGTREPFTAEDDRILYKWGMEAERQGIATAGNEIWKQLELKNARHPWQSWRARWVKQMSMKPPLGWEDAPIEFDMNDRSEEKAQPFRQSRPRMKTPESPPSKLKPKGSPKTTIVRAKVPPSPRIAPADANANVTPKHNKGFTTENFLEIYENVDEIMNASYAVFVNGWKEWAEETKFTAEEWENFFKNTVLRVHKEFNDGPRTRNAILKCLNDFVRTSPQQPIKSWLLHLKEAQCPTFQKALVGNVDTTAGEALSPSTPSRKRVREEESSPRVAETANTKRMRVERASQSSISKLHESIEEGIIETVNTKAEQKNSQTIDLTDLKDSSTSSDEELEEELQELPQHQPRVDDTPEVSPHILQEDVKYPTLPDTAGGTQAILTAETQDIDFGVPEPEGGFYESIETTYTQEAADEQHDQELIDQQLHEEVKKSDEIEPDMDFEIPEPEGGFESMPVAEDAPADDDVADESEDSDVDEDEIEAPHFPTLAKSLMAKGYTPQDIIAAIHSTSANLNLLDVVLASLRAGKGVPQDVRGIWTKQDDAALQGGDARAIRAMEAKHGWKGPMGCETRWKFLKSDSAGKLTR